uniref:Uncharacterized protein n=1 Tax=Rhodococcus sp. NS1 TaxID=402236 RepID=A0A097SR24_9NOCA|nr:hypothetical protein LRS1606.521 [Rhodococcus sp. NS1]
MRRGASRRYFDHAISARTTGRSMAAEMTLYRLTARTPETGPSRTDRIGAVTSASPVPLSRCKAAPVMTAMMTTSRSAALMRSVDLVRGCDARIRSDHPRYRAVERFLPRNGGRTRGPDSASRFVGPCARA